MQLALSLFICLVAVALTVVAGSTLWSAMHAWRTPEDFEATGYPDADEPCLSFSLIVPCRDETEGVMRATVSRLLLQTHPRVQVVISVGHDDADTWAIARRLAGEDARVQVSVNTDARKNKPRQLNTALSACHHEVVGIIDAESLTHPDLLRHVDTTFRRQSADVVQGAVHLVNYRATWFSLRNCVEYRTWFRSRLHGAASAGFVPLGGNTVFIRRALLDEVGGWDGDCLAEDCEIGVRLSTLGKKIVCVYDGELTTKEEAPESVHTLVKQRTRWSLGFMQVLAKGEWRRLPTARQRVLAWWTLVQCHAMAFTGVALPVAIVLALTADVPMGVALLSFLPIVPTLLTVAFEVFILREFGADLGLEVGVRDYVRLIVSTPFYQVLLALASLRAVWKFTRGDFRWEKTSHVGAHIPVEARLSLVEGGVA